MLCSSHEWPTGQLSTHTPSSESEEQAPRQDTHHLQHRKTWETDKTYICFQNQRFTLYYYHQHHCHNHQLTAVSFVGTVATVVIAVAYLILVDTMLVFALPGRFGANVIA